MSKSTHFLGQPSYLQLIKFFDKSKIDHLIRANGYEFIADDSAKEN